ncbi:MAG: TIGR03960 family B12-binding radical SAM protein, partial [Clostridia bacterium]|nr:TIGR03960 family B12-binding radical SAM protein [Clostridia bacterium]
MNLDAILKKVEKPSRYIGNEYNSVHKNPAEMNIRFGFCFADVYEIGMSHLGMKILYHLLNSADDIYCERFFTPWVDMEEQMREHNIPLFSLETKTPAKEFDFLGFTLQYEMSYTNILNMLDLSGIPLYAKDRSEEDPIICAGGPCAYNPEPLADFIDFFMLGEGEELMMEVMDVYRKVKENGGTKDDFLKEAVKLEGVYVPKFYDVSYNEDGTIKSFTKNYDGAPDKIRKRIIKDFDKCFAPDNIIVPFMEIVHDRIMLEVFRGCIRGCRFCQAGMIYRPVRERSPETLLDLAQRLIKNTGYEEISLSSLSTSDYTKLKELTDGLLTMTEEKKIGLSLPSLRLDNFSMELMQKVQKVRKSGLTFAPEAGTQRLRDVINKNITEEDLTNAAQMAFSGGYGTIKLYFMIGLPTETDEDILGISHLADEVVSIYKHTDKEIRNKNLRVTVSVSSFVPKPFTP